MHKKILSALVIMLATSQFGQMTMAQADISDPLMNSKWSLSNIVCGNGTQPDSGLLDDPNAVLLFVFGSNNLFTQDMTLYGCSNVGDGSYQINGTDLLLKIDTINQDCGETDPYAPWHWQFSISQGQKKRVLTLTRPGQGVPGDCDSNDTFIATMTEI